MVKAIETIYNGYRFRSRLEARWAVFFDKLNITYKYEHEGFDLDGKWYLPDFYLPDYSYWIEIKPERPNGEEREKAIRVCIHTQQEVLLFAGDVWHDVKGYGFHPFPSDKKEAKEIVKMAELDDNPECWISKDEFININSDKTLFGIDKRRGYLWTTVFCAACQECKQVSLGYEDVVHKRYCKSRGKGKELSKSLYITEAYTAARQARF